ncbi:MAG: cupin domain-containing protein [Alphaproteobacteria bacterium]
MSDTKERACWLDPMTVPPQTGSICPSPFHEPLAGRAKRALGNVLDLTQFGVNLVTFVPGAWSSRRYRPEKEAEFVYVLEGEATLVTDAGETVLKHGMAAGFPAGRADGHHLEVGTRALSGVASYSDIDMMTRCDGGSFVFTHKDGELNP